MGKRSAIYEEIQRWWANEVPTAPIFQGSLYLFGQKNVSGLVLSPTLRFMYAPIHRVK
jgi:ABC-type transport system substrate-binding protein